MAKQQTALTAAVKSLEEAERLVCAARAAKQAVIDQRAEAATELTAAEIRLREAADAQVGTGLATALDLATDEITRLRARASTYDAQVIPNAERRVEEAEEAANEARRVVAYAEAKQLADAAADNLVAKFPMLAGLLSELQAELSQAAEAVERTNRDLPHGVAALSDPEGRVRDRRAQEEVVVSRVEATCWAYKSNGQRLSPDQASRVRDRGDGSGVLTSGAPAITTEVEQRVFHRTEIQPAQAWRSGGRLRTVELGELSVATPAAVLVRYEPVGPE